MAFLDFLNPNRALTRGVARNIGGATRAAGNFFGFGDTGGGGGNLPGYDPEERLRLLREQFNIQRGLVPQQELEASAPIRRQASDRLRSIGGLGSPSQENQYGAIDAQVQRNISNRLAGLQAQESGLTSDIYGQNQENAVALALGKKDQQNQLIADALRTISALAPYLLAAGTGNPTPIIASQAAQLQNTQGLPGIFGVYPGSRRPSPTASYTPYGRAY